MKECWRECVVTCDTPDTIYSWDFDLPFAFASPPVVNITPKGDAAWLMNDFSPYESSSDPTRKIKLNYRVKPNSYMPITLRFNVRAIGV